MNRPDFAWRELMSDIVIAAAMLVKPYVLLASIKLMNICDTSALVACLS